ncbi:MAG: hypothetical protein WDA16_00645 [Candidatus Thermoplasmatota archaeon]
MRTMLLVLAILATTFSVVGVAEASGPGGSCHIVMGDEIAEVYGTGTPLDGKGAGVPKIECYY